MRMAKKMAAVALAAVMAVSMLTACSGGGGGTSSNNPGNTPGGGNTGTVTPGGGSGGDGNTDKPGMDEPDGNTDNPGTEKPDAGSGDMEKEDTVSYLNSRTGKFYRQLGTNYTIDANIILKERTKRGMLISTDGNRFYMKEVITTNETQQIRIATIDKEKRKTWEAVPMNSEYMTKLGYPDKKGIYIEDENDGSFSSLGIADIVYMTKPDNKEFIFEKQGTYYIESQITPGVKRSYWYEGDKEYPQYMIYQIKNNTTEYYRVEFHSVDNKENETLLYEIENDYIDYNSISGIPDVPNIDFSKMFSNSLKHGAKRPVVW